MPDQTATVADLRRRVADFVADRQWHCYHDAKNLAMSIAIEAGELMEHFQWVRNDQLPALFADQTRRAQVKDELADVFCYVLALSNVLELDLSSALIDKLAANAVKYPAERFRGRYYKPGSAEEQPPR